MKSFFRDIKGRLLALAAVVAVPALVAVGLDPAGVVVIVAFTLTVMVTVMVISGSVQPDAARVEHHARPRSSVLP